MISNPSKNTHRRGEYGPPVSDDFFSAIRSMFNACAHDPDLKRINFILTGKTHPAQFMKDRLISPFNVGTHISLDHPDTSEERKNRHKEFVTLWNQSMSKPYKYETRLSVKLPYNCGSTIFYFIDGVLKTIHPHTPSSVSTITAETTDDLSLDIVIHYDSEEIQKTLTMYGLIVSGKTAPEKLNDKFLAAKIKNIMHMVSKEVSTTADIHNHSFQPDDIFTIAGRAFSKMQTVSYVRCESGKTGKELEARNWIIFLTAFLVMTVLALFAVWKYLPAENKLPSPKTVIVAGAVFLFLGFLYLLFRKIKKHSN